MIAASANLDALSLAQSGVRRGIDWWFWPLPMGVLYNPKICPGLDRVGPGGIMEGDERGAA